MATQEVLSRLPVEGAVSISSGSGSANYLPVLNSQGVLDPSLVSLAGSSWKMPVTAVATTPTGLSGLQTIDSVTLTAGQRVLAANESSSAANGIFIASSGIWTRAIDANSPSLLPTGTIVPVTSGTLYSNTLWILTSTVTSVGTSPIIFGLFSSGGTSGVSGYSGASTSGYSGYSGSGISGYSGYSGISGYSSVSGYSGISGWSGKSGYSGVSGYSGSGLSGYSGSGISGWSGASGTSGWSGYAASGASGTSGWSGASGQVGPSGTSGYSGISGYSGVVGAAGASGYSGISGYSGSGISGYSGTSGFGISGYSGYSGFGISGYSGYSGSGISGYSGTSGAIGDTGTSGYSGYSGYSGLGSNGAFKNIITNGDFSVNQRYPWNSQNGLGSTSGVITPTAAGTLAVIDRWVAHTSTSGAVTYTQQIGFDTTTAPCGTCMQITANSYTLTGSDTFVLQQTVDANDVIALGWINSQFKNPATLSFWVFAPTGGVTGGVFTGSLFNCRTSSIPYTYTFTYTVTSNNAWQQITVPIPAPSSNLFFPYSSSNFGNVGYNSIQDALGGLAVRFVIGSVQTGAFTSGIGWQFENDFYGVLSGMSGIFPNNTMYITQVQLEPGSFATAYENDPMPLKVSRCQRFFERSYIYAASGSNTGVNYFNAASSGFNYNTKKFIATKNYIPIVNVYSNYSGSSGVASRNGSSDVSVAISGIDTGGFTLITTGTVSAGDVLGYHYQADSEFSTPL